MKTTTSLKHALALITALALVATNSVFADEVPDLDDPKVRDQILTEAVMRDTLEELGPEGAKLFYAPGSQVPYTGWTKRLYDNDKVNTLGQVKAGKPEGLERQWHDNGQKSAEFTLKDGKMEGFATKWDKAGKMTKQIDYRKGSRYRERYIPKAPAAPRARARTKEEMAEWMEKHRRGNAPTTPKAPNLDDPKVREKILKEALLRDTLEERGPKTAKLFYTPDSQIPYTGWTKRLHDNGKVKTLGHVRDGIADGPLIAWHENENKEQEGTFKDGKQEGLMTAWYPNGMKAQEGAYRNGKQEGPWIFRREDGKKWTEGAYKAGEKEGPWTLWDEDGSVLKKSRYKDGEEVKK